VNCQKAEDDSVISLLCCTITYY